MDATPVKTENGVTTYNARINAPTANGAMSRLGNSSVSFKNPITIQVSVNDDGYITKIEVKEKDCNYKLELSNVGNTTVVKPKEIDEENKSEQKTESSTVETQKFFEDAVEYESNLFTVNESLLKSSKTEIEDKIYSSDETITVKVEDDEEVQKWLKEHPGYDANIIWWVEFSCDSDKCEGFDNHLGKGKTNTLLEGRRASVKTIEMKAPKAKDGYHFVGWEKGTTTIGNSGVTVQSYKAIYEEDKEQTPEMFDGAFEYESNSFTLNGSLYSSSKSVEEDIIDDEKVTVSVEGDSYVQEWLKEHPGRDANIIWWVQFSCDLDKCEGFDNHLGKGKTDKLLEGRRAEISEIEMTAPKAKDGYHFVGWKKGTTTIGESEVTVQSYEAIYEADEKTEEVTPKSENLPFDVPEIFDDVVEYNNNSFTVKGAAPNSSQSSEDQTEDEELIEGKEISVSVDDDEELKEFFKNHPKYPKQSVIWWVQFSCDMTKCEGFDNHLESRKTGTLLEGRRAEISEIKMTAPEAKDGYHFVGWKKSTTTIGTSKVTVRNYEAIYEADEKTEETTPKVNDSVVESDSLVLSEDEILTFESQISDVEEESYSDKEEITVNSEASLGEFLSKHKGYNDYSVIWWSKFKCDLNKCNGFDGQESILLSRRGDSDITITAPEAKNGYHFAGWKRYLIKALDDGYKVYGYEAVYEEDKETEFSTLLLKEKLADVKELNQSTEKKDHECSKPEDGIWTNIVKNENGKLTIKYEGCHHYVSFAQFVCDLNECVGFNGSDKLTESRRGGTELTVDAPEAREGYHFVGWKKYDLTVDGFSWSYYKANYEKDEESSNKLSTGEMLTPKQVVKLSSIKSNEYYSTENKVVAKVSNDKNVQEWLKKHNNAESSIIWWAKFKCDLNMCEGFDGGQESITEGRRAEIHEIEMTAPKAKDGYKFVGWKVSEEQIKNVTIQVFEAVYEAI